MQEIAGSGTVAPANFSILGTADEDGASELPCGGNGVLAWHRPPRDSFRFGRH
jgi:hypothetical protein